MADYDLSRIHNTAEDFDRICTNLKNAVESYNSGQPGPVQSALKAARLIGLTEKDTVWLTKAATIMNRCIPHIFALSNRHLPDSLFAQSIS